MVMNRTLRSPRRDRAIEGWGQVVVPYSNYRGFEGDCLPLVAKLNLLHCGQNGQSGVEEDVTNV
jgi:hypothetical protein